MSRGFECGIVCVDINETCTVGIVDILWYGKGEVEFSVFNLICSVVKVVLPVCEV